MRLYGWCTSCHKFKQVNVKHPTTGPLQMGICDDCEAERGAR